MFKNPEFSFLETTLKDVPLPKLGSDFQHIQNQDKIRFHLPNINFYNEQASQLSFDIKPLKNYKVKKEMAKTDFDSGSVVKRKRGRPPKVRTDQSSIPPPRFLMSEKATIKNEICTQNSTGNFNVQQFSCQKT